MGRFKQHQQPIAVAKEPLNYETRVVKKFEQNPITEQLDFSVPKHLQLSLSVSKHEPRLTKHLKTQAIFLTVRQQMDKELEVKKT